MEKKEKIIELIGKENLSPEEEKFLSEAFQDEPELKEYKAIYEILRTVMERSHPSIDQLAEYILLLNGLSENSAIRRITPKIERHISECDKCREEFEFLNREYQDTDNFVSETFTQAAETDMQTSKKSFLRGFFDYSAPKYAFASLFAIVLLYFSLFVISEVVTPDYKNLAEISQLDILSSNRGRLSPSFRKGLIALKANDYDAAIKHLKSDLVKNTSDETLFYTHYVLGLVYLKKSESDIFGLFTSFNESDLDEAIKSFNASIELNRSRYFLNIRYDSYFFLGKAYLLKEDFSKASYYFDLVITNKGNYYREAAKLLKEIND